MIKNIMISVSGGALLASTAIAAPAFARHGGQVYGKDASISYANRGGIRDWHADDDRAVFIRDRSGRWYLATLTSFCPGLTYSRSIAFETDAIGRFDTFSAIRTPEAVCQVDRIVTSPAPAAKGGPHPSH